MANSEPDELDVKFAEKGTGVRWGLELEPSDETQKSVFYAARKVLLDSHYIQIQLPDGTYASYPIAQVRKILAMRADPPAGYTDVDLNTDELY